MPHTIAVPCKPESCALCGEVFVCGESITRRDFIENAFGETSWKRLAPPIHHSCKNPDTWTDNYAEINPGYPWNTHRYYCSKACRWRFLRARRRAERLEADRCCEVCGEAFHANRRDARYCSPRCSQKAYRGRLRGQS